MLPVLHFLVTAALAPIPCTGDITSTLQSRVHGCYGDASQCVIAIGPGTCYIDEVIELCPGVEIEGFSEQHTHLDVAEGTTAFHVLPYEQCQTEGNPWVGRVRLEKLTIDGTRSSSISYGLHAENHFRADRLQIYDFTQGVRIVSDVNLPVAGNANMFRMEEVYVARMDHSGFYLDGGDVNAGLLSQISVDSRVCENPSPFLSDLGPCHGIDDDGFLGNVYIATHVADVKNGGLPYNMTNWNARHALVGAYAETNQPPGYLSPTSLALGGLALWGGPGTWIQGNNVNSLRFINDLDPTNVVRLELGEVGGTSGTFMAMRSDALNPGWPLRWKVDPAQGVYYTDVAGLGVNNAITRIVGVSNHSYSLGSFLLRSSLFVVE